MLTNHRAHAKCFFVCPHCGRLSEDRYGIRRVSDSWNGHCIAHARMVPLGQLQLNAAFRATLIAGQPIGPTRSRHALAPSQAAAMRSPVAAAR